MSTEGIKTYIEQPSQSPEAPPLIPQDQLLPIAVLAAVGIFLSTGNSIKKGQLSDNSLATNKDLKNARKQALQLIRNGVKNKVALYLGSEKKFTIPSAERGTAVVGAPGSGKTYGVIDPAIRSALDQGKTAFIYDIKGELLKRHAAYAAAKGYQVSVFAPGFDYSGTLNFLDFLRDEYDSTMARELAKVIIKNSTAKGSKSDPFFGPLGEMFAELLFLMAKGSPLPDIVQAWSLLDLPKIEKRLVAAKNNEDLNLWTQISAAGILSVADAEKTVAGIKGQAVNVFSGLVNRDFIPVITGDSTIPLDVDGKQVIFFQIDEQRSEVTAPLVATAIHMLVKRNLNAEKHATRQSSLCLFLDELPSLYLPDLDNWLNQKREYGLCAVLGYQNDAQLRQRYGPDIAESLLSACATKFIFNPNHAKTAKGWSDFLGEKEVQIKTQSRSYGRNRSRSRNESIQRVPLFPAEKINRLKPGEFILISPGMQSIPYHCKRIKIPKADIKAQGRSEKLWDEKVRSRLAAGNKCLNGTYNSLEELISDRAVMADCLLPPELELAASVMEG